MEKLQQSDTKPAMYAEAFEELVLARKAKSEEIAALGKEIVQHLADCGEEGFTMETKFGFWVVKKHLISFAKTHKELTKECKKLTRENMKEQWPLWKVVLRCD